MGGKFSRHSTPGNNFKEEQKQKYIYNEKEKRTDASSEKSNSNSNSNSNGYENSYHFCRDDNTFALEGKYRSPRQRAPTIFEDDNAFKQYKQRLSEERRKYIEWRTLDDKIS